MTAFLCRRPARPSSRQRGAAAVELAIMLPLLVVVLAPLILYARFMWHYTVVQKAAQDAARYMANVPQVEMKSKKLAAIAKDVAVDIARKELADLSPGEEIFGADVRCGERTCGTSSGLPDTVNVNINFHMFDTFMGIYLPSGLLVEANVTMRYVGR